MTSDDGTVWCDGMPTHYGCAERIKPKRRWTAEGMKSGWLVTHSVDDLKGTPSMPLFPLHFCPSCAQIVLRQIAKQEGAR